jgi:hypothetical protein
MAGSKSTAGLVLSGNGGAIDQHLISSFYQNYKIINRDKMNNTETLLNNPDVNSNIARNKLRLKLSETSKAILTTFNH